MTVTVNPFPNDPVHEDILEHAGSELLFAQATGFERAMADTDAQRLTAIYAELVSDQWDADKISYRNLPFLAWAVGCNLWEEDWDETFKRWWVKQQWELKAQRGSLIGIERFVRAVKAEVVRAIRPPAIAYPRRADTDEERAAYVSRFPQLRMYPYVAREMLPWLCYSGDRRDRARMSGDILSGIRWFHRNGSFLGPKWKLYPTVQNQGGKYTRTATLWDHGIETNLTVRKIVRVSSPEDAGWGFTPGVSAYDEEVVMPTNARLCFFYHKYLNGGAHHGLFPNKTPKLRTITIARSGKLELTKGKAQYQTTSPQVELLRLEPELVATRHHIRPPELYGTRRTYLHDKYLPRSNAWRNIYEKWYVFDADRVPDYRRKSIYMGHARFGIRKYHAELKIRIRTNHRRWLLQTKGYVYGFFKTPSLEPINKVRRAVTAAMALRDTVLIDTTTVRHLQVRDIHDASGRVYVGQLVGT